MRTRLTDMPRHLLALVVLWSAPLAVMAEEKQYDVEIIIFSHNNRTDHGEAWPFADEADGPTQNSYPGSSFTKLSADSYRLKPVRYTLQRAGEYSVLYHRAWRQLAYSPSRAVSYPVQTTTDSGYRLEGALQLKRGRYLHLDVDLRLLGTVVQAPGQFLPSQELPRAYRLTERRRLRGDKLHYFDHPRFGLLALVTPVSMPESAEDETTTPEATAPVTETSAAPVAETSSQPAEATGNQSAP